MSKYGKTGVSKDTPKNILFGAGTIHKNLKYDSVGSTWNFEQSIVGATSGGSKLKIVPEFVEIEADGVHVKTKGLKVKVGENAEMEINFLELTKELIKTSVIAKDGVSEDKNMDLIESKGSLEDADFLENIAFVGKTLEGKDIIVILDNALCTSGLELSGENKKEGVVSYTFECHADLKDADLDILPWHIYYPKVAV